MKTIINLFWLSFLVLLLTFFYTKAIAKSVNFDNNIRGNNFFQNKAMLLDPAVTTLSINSGKLKVPPVINLTVNTYLSSIALLKWTTTDAGLQGNYVVKRSNLSGVWVDIATLPNTAILAYNDTISYPFCNPTNFSYQIQFNANSSPSDNATSTIAGPYFLSDLTSPVNVTNLIVTLGPTISWDKITADAISNYEIQRFDPKNKNWPQIGSTPSSLKSFVDPGASPACANSFRYIVRTVDMCGKKSAPDYENKYVQTIKLYAAQPGQCDKSAKLVWNSYKNIPGGLGGYTISRKEGNDPAVDINATDTTFIDYFNFKDGLNYSYSVTAYSKDGLYSSSSCKVGWLYNSAILPDTVYITQVSVEDDSYIRVQYYFSPVSTVTRLYLERSDDNGLTFYTIDTILSPVPQKYHFSDTTADVHAQSYYYRLVAIDDCDNKSMSIYTSRSIWLQCTPSETENTLDWNTYESWLEGVEGYDVFRTLNMDPSSEKTLTTAGPATTSYSDLLSSFDSSKMPCYWVEAKENPGNPYLQNAISRSNSCCVIKDPIIFMPNAFRPDGKNNKVFRPVPDPLFIDTESFKMTIFNRWGQQLFETTDMISGWNGSVNGQYEPAGQYVYLITYKSPEGKDYTKRGTVVLVR